jgi:hypothetical protein
MRFVSVISHSSSSEQQPQLYVSHLAATTPTREQRDRHTVGDVRTAADWWARYPQHMEWCQHERPCSQPSAPEA